MLVISDNIVSDKVSTSILDSRRFLLAEDNALNREIIVELFAMFGAQVETAVDGKEAVAAFESRPTGYYDGNFYGYSNAVNGWLRSGTEDTLFSKIAGRYSTDCSNVG